MNVEDRVRELIAPILTDLDVELFDVELNGGRLLVTVDSEKGLDTGTLYLTTRAISRELDQTDPVPGTYTLEVSSPGLERKLRRPVHWQKSIGSDVTVKVRQDFHDERRLTGRIVSAGMDSAVIALAGADGDASELTIPYEVVQKAKTIFEWGPTPKKGGKNSNKKKTAASKNASTKNASEKPAGKKKNPSNEMDEPALLGADATPDSSNSKDADAS